MRNPRLAKRYAKSLIDLAVLTDQLEAVRKDMAYVHAVCSKSREFSNMLRSPIINADKKKAVSHQIFQEKISILSERFISLLIQKGREAILQEITTAFIDQYKELKNIKTVKLTTPVPLHQSVKNMILQRATASLTGYQIELIEDINPDLIGGFVLEMGDKQFDASILHDLKKVKAQFRRNLYINQIR